MPSSFGGEVAKRKPLKKSNPEMLMSGFSRTTSLITLPSLVTSLTPQTISSPRFVPMASSQHNSTSTNGNNCPPHSTDSPVTPSSAIDFLTLCQSLKKTKRTGWVKKDVENPESISDHMHRMGLMALISADIPGVNRDKCVKMAIVHDIAEAIVGDITPHCGISKIEKNLREQEALDRMCNILGGGSRAQEIRDLWMEYEENSSLEAKLVKDFDKLEMILQAWEYEKDQGKDLEEFFESTAGKFHTEIGKAWALEIVSRRKNH